MRVPTFLLFLVLLAGLAVQVTAAEALPDLRQRAERGDPAARYDYARRIFEQGEGRQSEQADAFTWLEAAAGQGHFASLELAATLRIFAESDHFDLTRGLEHLRRAETINAGSPRVKFLRGLLHHQGRGRDYDPELGLKLVNEAAAAGDILAVDLLQEVKRGKSLAAALPYAAPPPPLLRQAEEGEAEAQWRLAELYFQGQIEHEEKRSPGFGWRERAAESDHAAAQAALGEALREGRGYPKDAGRALRWLMRAAAQNHARAAWLAGIMHRDGEGTVKDAKEAARLLSLALDHGSPEAEAPFGKMLVLGTGVTADPARGFTLLNRAEKRNDIEARDFLLTRSFAGDYAPQDAAQLQRLLEHGVRTKQTKAKTYLGIRLLRGEGLKQNISRGATLLREAMEEGDFQATQEYLAHLSAEMERLQQLKAKGQAVDSVAYELARNYETGLRYYAKNGGPEQRLEAAKALSEHWAIPSSKEFSERHDNRIDSTLRLAVAIGRVYRGEGGKDQSALRWLRQIEQHYANMKWQNNAGETAQDIFQKAEAEFRSGKGMWR